ncbi:MAG: glycosyltransferase family 9 protein [Armatimonadetes bacterium]|nr:glycosyltransferase family 9 protein [Armatimonadota bacterium]
MSDHVLVYQIGSLGDTIVSIPCYRAIRRHFRGKQIRLLEAKLKEGRVMPSDMLMRENLIDGVTQYPHGGTGLKGKLDVWKSVFKERPSTVVYIGPAERPPKVVQRDKAFFRMCGVPHLVGFHGVDYAQFQTRCPDGFLPSMPHQSRLRLERLSKDGVAFQEEDLATPLLHPTIEEKESVMDWLDKNRDFPTRKLVTIGFMTAKPLTRWPIERFEDLGRRLAETGQVELIVTGGPGEKAVGEHLVQAWGQGLVAAGVFAIHDMAALLGMSDLYIGLDTGTTHLAATVDAPILALYADHTQPGEWAPMGKQSEVMTHRVACGGCRGFDCSVQGHPCMAGLTVDMVLQRAKERLGL